MAPEEAQKEDARVIVITVITLTGTLTALEVGGITVIEMRMWSIVVHQTTKETLGQVQVNQRKRSVAV